MTDNEIMKAIKDYSNSKIIQSDNGVISIGDILDLINRQKAENEELISKLDELESEYTFYKISAQEQIEALIAGQETLQKALNEKIAEVEALEGNLYTISSACKQRRDESVKEFAERLKEKQQTFIGDEYAYKFIYLIEIDNLVKEMVGDSE